MAPVNPYVGSPLQTRSLHFDASEKSLLSPLARRLAKRFERILGGDWWGQLTSQVRKPSLRQIVRANENRPIHFGVAGNIFPPHLLLNGLAVGSEHLEFIFAVFLEVIVQGFAADGAAHPRFAISPVEKDNIALENKNLLGSRKCQVVPLKAPMHSVDAERCKRMVVHFMAVAVNGQFVWS